MTTARPTTTPASLLSREACGYRRWPTRSKVPSGLRRSRVFGQGLSVATQEAVLLLRLLAGAEGDLSGLADAYFSELPPMLEAPWAAAALDLVYPQTEGAA